VHKSGSGKAFVWRSWRMKYANPTVSPLLTRPIRVKLFLRWYLSREKQPLICSTGWRNSAAFC
jgi:hypothetical protein